MSSLPTITDEPQARHYGRARAKDILQPMHWKRIGTLSDEAARLYELTRRTSSPNPATSSCTLRAVKPLDASIDELEAVLTGQTALLKTKNAPSLLARLLPATYVSGDTIAQYPTLEHSTTSERESVSLHYARFKPYQSKTIRRRPEQQKQQKEQKEENVIESVDNYVFLGYTLSTKLQRSNTRKESKENGPTPRTPLVSVPSLLHLYRPVHVATYVGDRRHDVEAENMANHDFSITYIIQEMPVTQRQSEGNHTVTLEVMLTYSTSAGKGNDDDDKAKQAVLQQKLRLRHDALCLTRLQPFIDAYRQEKVGPPPRLSPRLPTPERQHDPKDCDPKMLRGGGGLFGRTCSVCHRKFGPFRWKRNCEACEKGVCNQCLSVLASTPSLSRRKRRVCSQCLYGEQVNIATILKGAGSNDSETVTTPRGSHMSVFQSSSLESLVLKHKSSRTAALIENGTPSRASNRVQIDLGLDPSLVEPRGARSRQSQHSQRDTTDSFFPASRGSRRATLPSPNDPTGLESAVAKSMRFRRATTVLHEAAQPKPLSHKSLKFFKSPLATSTLTPSMYFTSEKSEKKRGTNKVNQRSDHASTMVQLTTPEPDYELDFSWYNIFPKAPMERSAEDVGVVRGNDVDVTDLKLDLQALVFLRHDKELVNLAQCVLNFASQWHVCNINVVGSYEVYCLVTASTLSERDAADDVLKLELSPVPIDEVIPREESVSSYAVHHRTVFFVSELEHDPRFRAHPVHTEQGVVSLLSFPIYSSGASDPSGSSSPSEAFCIATVDLWKKDQSPASSHVSSDWMMKMKDLVHQISARLEALALESHAFLKPRARAANSFGSSCDSRDSTRRADSMIDLHDIDSESVVITSPLSHAETMDRLTTLSYAKVRGMGLGGLAGHGFASTWKYDSDNESITSSRSASSTCSQSSRFSSHLYSAADMHTTMESLLQQASKTSQYISETGVFV